MIALDGWVPDPRRSGFLRHPDHPSVCRTPDGRWWSKLDIDNAVRVVREAGRVVRIELEDGVRELQDRQRRLGLTPADEVADEKAMADPELVRALREVTRRG